MSEPAGTFYFPDNLERLLGLHRLTAERAAELIGVSPTTLSYWRNGKQSPGARAQHSLLAFFEVDFGHSTGSRSARCWKRTSPTGSVSSG
jgi:transcriptional regulator with XRE-family HTH domain